MAAQHPRRFGVAVVGSANVDLVARAARLPSAGETVLGNAYAEHPGGKGLNQAIAAARAGAAVAFCGAVGDDAGSAIVTATLDADGVDRTHLAIVQGVATGRALIGVDDRGENQIIVVPGANDHVASDAAAACAAGAAVVLAQLEIPLDAVRAALRAGRAHGAITVLNPAPAAMLDGDVLARCDVIVPNEHEVTLLGGADHLLDGGVGTVVVTRGSAGVTLQNAGHPGVVVPSVPVEPLDTTGAGDAFCGALAARLAAGATVADAVRFAVAAGALATTAEGAVPSLPHRAAIEAALGSAVRRAT
jgi:ribokinase